MEEKVKYHFSIHILFEQDVDVKKLAQMFKIEPYKLIMLNDSVGQKKTAKMWYRTKDITNVNTGEKFEKFVLEMKEVFKELPKFLEEFNGICEFAIIFTDMNEKPCLHITKETVKALESLNASVDFDFYV